MVQGALAAVALNKEILQGLAQQLRTTLELLSKEEELATADTFSSRSTSASKIEKEITKLREKQSAAKTIFNNEAENIVDENYNIIAAVSQRFRNALQHRVLRSLQKASEGQAENVVQNEMANIQHVADKFYDTIRSYISNWYRVQSKDVELLPSAWLRTLQKQQTVIEDEMAKLSKDWEKLLCRYEEQKNKSEDVCAAEKRRSAKKSKFKKFLTIKGSILKGKSRCFFLIFLMVKLFS